MHDFLFIYQTFMQICKRIPELWSEIKTSCSNSALEDWYETCVYFVPIQFVNLHKKLYHIYLFKVVNNFPNN